MKIDKNKLPGDLQGFFLYLEDGEKFQEMLVLGYKIFADIMNNHRTNKKNFIVNSGKLILTSVGNDELCSRIMWSFPPGTFNAYIVDEIDTDSIFIPFRKFESKTIRYQILLTVFHFNDVNMIPSGLIDAPCLQVNGAPLFLMDEAEWTKYKSVIYSQNNGAYEETIEDLNNKVPGKSIILPFKFNENSESREDKGMKCFYFAYSGLTLDGDPAYLWLRKVKRYDKK